MAKITLDRVSRRYGNHTVLNDVHLQIADGELLTLLGPSGCGKTTALRIVAGFVAPTAGHVRMNDEDVTSRSPQRRNVGMVFQDYALFPHLTVADNIGFGLLARRETKVSIAARVAELLALVQLEGLGGRRPTQLSGGQQQRVALARAIAHRPAVLLMDEPFAALDRALRETMQSEVRAIQRRLGITTIFVTHDQAEALSLSDRVALLKDGRVLQVDTPEQIYRRPLSRFVAGFLGQVNLLEGDLVDENREWSTFRSQERTYRVPVHRKNGILALGVRPEHLKVRRANAPASTDPVNTLPGTAVGHVFQGDRARLIVETQAARWTADVSTSHVRFGENEPVMLEWDYADSLVLE